MSEDCIVLERRPRGGRGLVSGLAAVCVAAALGGGRASADVTIIGALSNFDVPNQTPETCDEFEIEFEGPHPEDIYGFWANYNYGMPSMTALPGNIGVLVSYHRAGHTTAPGVTEHFGVHMTNFSLITRRTFRWKHNGAVVTSGPGQPPVPIPVATVVVTPTETVVVEAVENESPEEVIWVRRSVIVVPREVALAELMPDDPLITAATPIEVDLEKLEPGETLEAVEPLDPEDYIQTQIIVVETFNDVPTWNPTTLDYDHAPGERVSQAMNAAVIETTPCEDRPVILAHPADARAPIDGRATFAILADSPPAGGEVFYQWHRDGVDIEGEDQPTLTVDPVGLADAGQYTCSVTNDCGTSMSAAATLTAGSHGDMNCDGEVNFNDIDGFVAALVGKFAYEASYTGCPWDDADCNADGLVNFDDIDSFVVCLILEGCP